VSDVERQLMEELMGIAVRYAFEHETSARKVNLELCFRSQVDLLFQAKIGDAFSALRAQLAWRESDFAEQETVIAALRAEVARLMADARSFQRQLEVFEKMHWELVDLFDKDARGVSPLHFVKERIARLTAEAEHVKGENAKWVAHARRLFKLKSKYREQLAVTTERLAAAEKESDSLIKQALADAGIDMEPAYARLREMIAAAKAQPAASAGGGAAELQKEQRP